MFRHDLFWQRVERADNAQCWLWRGPVSRDGYGNFTWKQDGRSTGRRPHRIVYEQLVGVIPEGLTLDHLCRNRLCCNPAHLEPCERGENARRGEVGQRQRDKVQCPQGHPYSGDNLYLTPSGHRQCRTCIAARAPLRREYSRKRREASDAVR